MEDTQQALEERTPTAYPSIKPTCITPVRSGVPQIIDEDIKRMGSLDLPDPADNDEGLQNSENPKKKGKKPEDKQQATNEAVSSGI